MNRVRIVPALALLAFAAPGAAQSPQSGGAKAELVQHAGAAVRTNQLESVLGREVRTRDRDGGRIVDLLVDDTGHIRAAVIEFGGFLGIGTRKIAVDWSAMNFEPVDSSGAVFVDVNREQLQAAPEYKPAQPVVVRKAAD
jgi:hypothetical protein